MKLLISWIFDHLGRSYKDVDIRHLIKELNAKTAEIEGFREINTDIEPLALAKVIAIDTQAAQVECAEWRISASVTAKDQLRVGDSIFIKRDHSGYKRALTTDFGGENAALLPAIFVDEKGYKGGWRDTFVVQDVLLHIDNKALTNRPDLWGHRGFAREVSVLLGINFVPDEHIYADVAIKHYPHRSPKRDENEIKQAQSESCINPFMLEIVPLQITGQPCKRLAGYYFSELQSAPSILPIAARLARIDVRPQQATIDLTNYVMFDIGHPIHAFDAEKIPSHAIVGRNAHEGEQLILLDGESVQLLNTDYVLTDGKEPIAVAGIMGGLSTAVTNDTKSVFIEAGHFDPVVIRHTSARLKKRTEASARFEKTLDPNQNTQALLRFIKLLSDAKVPHIGCDALVSIGELAKEKVITLAHQELETKLGISADTARVQEILRGLGFGVEVDKGQPVKYTVTVPTFRSTKDITIPEDIIEEVARFIGYETITPVPPLRRMSGFNTDAVNRVRALKQLFAYGLECREVQNYAFFDEEFLRVLKFDPQGVLEVANPLSQHWKRLVNTLIPNLLKCVVGNSHQQRMRFFEWNRVWFLQDTYPVEEEECAGIWVEQKEPIDFYQAKAWLDAIFAYLGIEVAWARTTAVEHWYDPGQSASIYYKERIIGTAGKLAQQYLPIVGASDAFIFEIDANFLTNVAREKNHFAPLKKFPTSDLDISMLIDKSYTVQAVQKAIAGADRHIVSVAFVDSFERPEWGNRKSMTFRFVVYNEDGTLTTQQIDSVWDKVVNAMNPFGAEIR